jgi:hypothetical protein
VHTRVIWKLTKHPVSSTFYSELFIRHILFAHKLFNVYAHLQIIQHWFNKTPKPLEKDTTSKSVSFILF